MIYDVSRKSKQMACWSANVSSSYTPRASISWLKGSSKKAAVAERGEVEEEVVVVVVVVEF